jgi:NarL family two-component system response regulator LiaR
MMTDSLPIRVLLVDDHEMVRRGLAVSLLTVDDIEVVGEAATGRTALDLCDTLQPDVILMDLMMPDMNGVEATQSIRQRHPDIQIIALTSYKETELVESALKAGAIGYLLKDITLEKLAEAIRAAEAGQPTLAPEATKTLLTAFTRPVPPGQDLTPREREVLGLMVKGLTNPKIARQLGVNRSTIQTHVSNILAKLGVANRLEAVSLALEYNLVTSRRDSSPT